MPSNFGGAQGTALSAADLAYLQERQREIDAYEQERQAYKASFAEGGAVNVADLLAAEEEPAISTDPMGTAQKFVADLVGVTPTASSARRGPRTTALPKGSGSQRPKSAAMQMQELGAGDLGAMKDLAPKAKETDSARSQLEELARQYTLKVRAAQNKARGLGADTFGAPTLEGPSLTKNTLAKKRFAKGGEAKSDEVDRSPETEVMDVSRVVNFLKGVRNRTERDFLEDAKSRAEKDENYRAMLEYLRSRDAVPDVKVGYLPEGFDAVFNATKLPIGSGTIKFNKNIIGSDYKAGIGPSTMAHEMAHATDRQMQQQANEQTRFFRKGNAFTDAYEKLVGPGGMRGGERRLDLARRFHPEWVSENKGYRATPHEIAAHGVGNYAGPSTTDKSPPHVDATAATEFQILLDLARRNLKGAVKRAEGSPEEGEVSAAELEAASRPAFVTPKSGKGRKEGPISRQLRSGEAYVNMAKGVTEMPYNLAGMPVDLFTLAMRPFGYKDEKPVLGSEWIKEQMTGSGPLQVRPAPPTDPTSRGFYTAGDLLSNLVNPAGVARAGVRGAQKVGQAATGAAQAVTDVAKDFQAYNRQLAVPGASYAARPEGSPLFISRERDFRSTNTLGDIINRGVEGAENLPADRADAVRNFWESKATNYFAKQFGTESDPVYRMIREQGVTSPSLAREFPGYALDQLSVGKTRVNEETGQTRFFPKYPQAWNDMRNRYDRLTGITGAVPEVNPSRVMDPELTYANTPEARARLRELQEAEIDKIIRQGTPVAQANPNLEFLTRSIKDIDQIVGPYQAKELLRRYERATGSPIGAPDVKNPPEPSALPQNLRTTMEKGEIIYASNPDQVLRQSLFDPQSINEYLATLPTRELAKVRFEDAVKGGAKLAANRLQRETLVADIRAGKRVDDKFFSEGVSKPLLQVKEGPFEGFAWKRIEDPEATAAEGAYVGHSVGGYAKGGGYGPEKHKLFKEGKYQVYTLRDNRNRPVNTIEVRMEDVGGVELPVVTQIKGNGRATGNAAPQKYDALVQDFLQNYLKPYRIDESESYLTPRLQALKAKVYEDSFDIKNNAIMRELGLE